MKTLKNKKGFTIVELVIVIAVIAILAAVLIPTFSGVVEKANESKRLQAARNAYTNWLADDDTSGNSNALNQDKVIGIKVDGTYWFTVKNGAVAKSGTNGKDEVKAGNGENDKIILETITSDESVGESSATSSS